MGEATAGPGATASRSGKRNSAENQLPLSKCDPRCPSSQISIRAEWRSVNGCRDTAEACKKRGMMEWCGDLISRFHARSAKRQFLTVEVKEQGSLIGVFRLSW